MNSLLKKNSKIIEEEENKYFIKTSNKNISELFDYLRIRNFDNIPEIIEVNEDNIKYKYIESLDKKAVDKHLDLANLLSTLHYKTAYYKDVSKNKYREIYDKLTDKVEYIEEFYKNLIDEIDMQIYPSPSEYLIQRNYSVINGALFYIKNELKKWFKLVENKNKERVVVVHNNPKIEHVIKGEINYLTNWDNYVVDTPVLDLYRLYKEEKAFDDFGRIYDKYNENFSLSEEETKLFCVLISIPLKIEDTGNELLNTKSVKEIINYLYKTNKLISSINSIKENANWSN